MCVMYITPFVVFLYTVVIYRVDYTCSYSVALAVTAPLRHHFKNFYN